MITVNTDELLVTWLTTQLGVTVQGVSSERPSDVEQHLPYVIVRRGGGGDRDWALDGPIVDVDVLAGDNSTAGAVARAVDAAFRFGTPAAWRGASLSMIRCNQAPLKVSDSNTALKHYASTYTLSVQ